MAGAPRLSVALSVYNDADHLVEAIDSVLGQSFADFELLIVDDGSTDGSGAIIDRYAAADARVVAIHEENRGLIASLNRLIGIARGSLIARMDGDDICHPDRFAQQVAWFDAHPEIGVLGAHTRDIDDRGRVIRDGADRPLDHAGIVAALEHSAPLCHPSAMMRTDVVRAGGGYRAAYRHCEDYDMWLRLAERTRLANLPDRLLDYRRSPGQVSNRHALAQQIGAAVALAARDERAAERPDPTDGLDVLPPVAELDRLFGRSGVATAVRSRVARNLVYSAEAMRGEGFALVTDHIRESGASPAMWRTVARLMAFGAPLRAARLAATLAKS